MTFAELVKSLREDRGLTQEELARISGVFHAVISYVERGKRSAVSVFTLAKLDKALRAKGKLFDYFRSALG